LRVNPEILKNNSHHIIVKTIVFWNAFYLLWRNLDFKVLMRRSKLIFLVLLLPLLSFVALHKFYVSVTHVDYSEKDQSLQLTTRIFLDDFESMLKQRYSISPHLSESKELPNINEYISRYLRQHIVVRIDGQEATLNYLGREYENDVIKCYIEIKNVNIKTVKHIQIENTTLFEMFDEQNNIIHFKIGDLRKSFSLIKENERATLNL